MAVTLHTSQGEPFTVDDEDAPLVKRFEWRLVTCKTKGGKQNRDLVTLVLPRFGSKSLRLRALIMGTHPQAGTHGKRAVEILGSSGESVQSLS